MKKKYWIPLAALAAVVILALALWPRSHWVQVVNADNRDEKTLVLWDGDVIAEYEGEYWAARYNMAGDRAVFRLLGETRDEDRALLGGKGKGDHPWRPGGFRGYFPLRPGGSLYRPGRPHPPVPRWDGL